MKKSGAHKRLAFYIKVCSKLQKFKFRAWATRNKGLYPTQECKDDAEDISCIRD